MNKIIEKFKIPGFETREIIVPMVSTSTKRSKQKSNGLQQLSLDLDTLSKDQSNKKNV